IENSNIEVLKYLPIEDKYNLINITLQNAREGSIYNSLLLDVYFHLYIVIMYSNITFTEKQKENQHENRRIQKRISKSARGVSQRGAFLAL
ncbi:MAG: hypothetical protein II025_02495, partial [Ruminococcus sp.]|nr:hypothetical protein [Ruminococcus sp.]